MQYVGGKAKTARQIAAYFLEHHNGALGYAEPFMGGASVLELIAPHFSEVVASDIHKDLMLMWCAAINGWVPPANLSRHEWGLLRVSKHSALRGFAGFGVSYGGRFFEGYAESKPLGSDYCGGASRRVVSQASAFRHARLYCRDYRLVTPPPGWLVYCDPPYPGKRNYYGGTPGFHHGLFWATMTSWANKGVIVYVTYRGDASGAREVMRIRGRQRLGSGMGPSLGDSLYVVEVSSGG